MAKFSRRIFDGARKPRATVFRWYIGNQSDVKANILYVLIDVYYS